MKLSTYLTGCTVLFAGIEASKHIQKREHRELLQRKRCVVPRDTKIKSLIKVFDDKACGWNGATHDITATSGPNGQLDWLNCGVDADGWNPPYVTKDDIITVDLDDALKDDNSPFKPCTDNIWAFKQAGEKYNVPPILLASFALQESSCNPHAVGGAGEQGLMQLIQAHCTDAPGGNCQDVYFNVHAGAKLFSKLLEDNGGNLLLAIGNYNGWTKGITIGKATEAGNGPNCRWQNNLDYLFQFLNGWVLNINAYTHEPRMGKYFNLDKCN